MNVNKVTERVIGAAIEVHRTLGPGLMESAYQQSLAREFELREISYEREKGLCTECKGLRIECAYRLDFLAENLVVVELKAIDSLLPVHDAQLLTYLRLGMECRLAGQFQRETIEIRHQKACPGS